MISGANENELEIANARADVLLSINDDRQYLLGLIKYWEEECFRYKKENQRLNNVLNELEKWLNSEIKRIEKLQNDTKNVKPYGQEFNNYVLIIDTYNYVLDKLNELKESDK